MKEQSLFIDGSVDTKSKTGFGAFLAIEGLSSEADFQSAIKIKRFDNTSSSKLELQNLLWALGKIDAVVNRLIIYTDSQNIVSLPGRRKRLEEDQYLSKNGIPLSNRRLYQEFFEIMDARKCRFEKVKGHQAQSRKGRIEKIFTQVDRAARAALRDFRTSTN